MEHKTACIRVRCASLAYIADCLATRIFLQNALLRGACGCLNSALTVDHVMFPLLCRTLAPLPNLRASILISTTGQAAQSSLCAVTEMSTVPAHYFDQNSQGPVSGRVL